VARPGWDRLTLGPSIPMPAVTVAKGHHVAVIAPPWGWGIIGDAHPNHAGLLREQCTVLLPGHGWLTAFPGHNRISTGPGQISLTIFLAVRSGTTVLSASPQGNPGPRNDGWWTGRVTVPPAKP
jgi:hypothetical protein